MERGEAKKILLFYRNIDDEISLNKRMLRDFEDVYCTPASTGLDGTPKSQKKSSLTESVALDIPDSASAAMSELRKNNAMLEELKRAIAREFNKLPFRQKSVLYDFYIRGLQWVQISDRIHYGCTQCKKIRNRGLDALAKDFSKNDLIRNFDYPN